MIISVDDQAKHANTRDAASESLLPTASPTTETGNPRHSRSARKLTQLSKRRRRLAWLAFSMTFVYLTVVSVRSVVFRHSAGDVRFQEFLNTGNEAQQPQLHKHKIETIFLSVPNNDSARAASVRLSTLPHLAGSEQDLSTARQFLALFQTEFGISKPEEEPLFDAGSKHSQRAIRGVTSHPRRIHKPIAWIDTYYPVLNTGVDQRLQILGDDGQPMWEADLREDGDPGDPDAERARTTVPTWHGLSKGGDVSGRIVYAKYGRKEDFDDLQNSGVDLSGTIALVRYGWLFRGLKIKAAQEAGCVGVLVYGDPEDDGGITLENGYQSWPHGPARNPTSVQRGSVQFISKYPGDPTTPGYPSYQNATRHEATSIPSIPSLPISWTNAARLLEEIPDGVKSKTIVRLYNEVDFKVTPIWNTMAVIPGILKDGAVLVGNHRDAWVLGSADPTSGSVSLHEVVRGLGALIKRGWKPLRTIVIASWDAEEYGLVGSTEWGEDFADWIQAHVVAYLNLDVAVSGSRYNLGGSPSLAHLLRDAALSVQHPTKKNLTLWDAIRDKGPYVHSGLLSSSSSLVKKLAHEEAWVEQSALPVNPLGSGSDYTVMLQRLGIASSDMGFGSTLSDAVYHYHSIYDSQLYQDTYVDPDFSKHVAVAQHLGLLTLRLADSVLLPINTTHYVSELFKYLDSVETSASERSIDLDTHHLRKKLESLSEASSSLDRTKAKALEEFESVSRTYSKSTQRLVSMVTRRVKTAKRWCKDKWYHRHAGQLHFIEELQPFVLAPEHAPAITFQHGVEGEDHVRVPTHPPRVFSPPRIEAPKAISRAMHRLRKINTRLRKFEQGFISEEGIKDREWYRHLGVAPGKWKGYGATPFPALSEAIEIEGDPKLARHEVKRLEKVVEKLTEDLVLE